MTNEPGRGSENAGGLGYNENLRLDVTREDLEALRPKGWLVIVGKAQHLQFPGATIICFNTPEVMRVIFEREGMSTSAPYYAAVHPENGGIYLIAPHLFGANAPTPEQMPQHLSKLQQAQKKLRIGLNRLPMIRMTYI